MNISCSLCSKQLPRFSKKSLTCCSEDEPLCGTCYDRLRKLSQEERGRVLLAEGNPVHAAAIETWLIQHEARQAARRETNLVCTRCGTPMLKMGRRHFQMGTETLFFDSHLFEGSLAMDILCCETCRKIEFFLPEDFDPKKF